MIRFETDEIGYRREAVIDYLKRHKSLLESDSLDNFYTDVEMDIIDGAMNTLIGLCTKFFILNGVDLFSKISKLYPAMFYGTDLVEIDIPGKFRDIPDRCFHDSKLSRINIEEGVEYICGGAFAGTHLGNIYLPDSVTGFVMSAVNDINPYYYYSISNPFEDNYVYGKVVISASENCIMSGYCNHQNIEINRRKAYKSNYGYGPMPNPWADPYGVGNTVTNSVTYRDTWSGRSTTVDAINDWITKNKTWDISD